ncbi:fimbrial protein [Enterobacter mori]|uniref:fimbrial protein n=1 Tax=Enterobacter mori TaxID=539813 RepID=UPI003B83F370
MKKSILAAIIALPFGLATMSASAVTVSGGTVNFQGEVVDAACSVASESVDQTVILDQIKSSTFTAGGEFANQRKAFEIKLADCSTGTQTTAAVSFNGNSDSSDTTLLANTAGAGAATNIGLALFGPDGQPIGLNDGTLSAATTIQDGTTIIPLSVDYKSTASLPTAGAVESVATFNVTYQ